MTIKDIELICSEAAYHLRMFPEDVDNTAITKWASKASMYYSTLTSSLYTLELMIALKQKDLLINIGKEGCPITAQMWKDVKDSSTLKTKLLELFTAEEVALHNQCTHFRRDLYKTCDSANAVLFSMKREDKMGRHTP